MWTDGVSTEIFTIRARKCLRCGGLLTSEQALADGYGHICKTKTLRESGFIQKPDSGKSQGFVFEDKSQISIFEMEENQEE